MFGNLIAAARQVRRSERVKNAINTPARIGLHARQRLNGGYFAIEIRANSGFFSVMQIVLCTLLHCDEQHLTPIISARGGSYGDPDGRIDWLAACFDNIATVPVPPGGRRLRTSVVTDLGDLGFRRYEAQLALEHASDVFLANYRPTASIQAEVDGLREQLGIGASTLGVHFRGTDKKFEAHTIERDAFCRMVETTLADHPHLTNVFVSSDEPAFLDHFSNWGFPVPVKIAPATRLAAGGKPVHFSGHAGLAIGREALVASLLLASCGYLLKTPSYLSAWSKLFNPSLPVRLAVPPRENAFWFPDSRIWIEQQQQSTERTAPDMHAQRALPVAQTRTTA